MMRKALFYLVPVFVLSAPLVARVGLFNGRGSHPAEGQEVTAAVAGREQALVEGVRSRLAEARRLLATRRPETTDRVTLAVEDTAGARLHLLDVSKETFLEKGAEAAVVSSEGEPLRLKVVRANGVNTAVRVSDVAGRELQPLLVQYPVEKEGRLKEVAYYASAHPALGSPGLVRGGGLYVRTMLGRAHERLAALGKEIDPEIVAAAERLCVVEHTDHKRFKREDRGALYDEIYTLYALNSGDTYRYSVSTAGAGGMVQMIPPTYEAIRAQHPEANLRADFVEGMRDHSNALQAMLLYMQDTWDYLRRSEEVRAALSTGRATQQELLAAGYNSNPMRLPGYLKRGGAAWRTLIPAETQMYLRIYASVEELADFEPRA
jgi:hypothetical protein